MKKSRKVALVFGESDNDRSALVELVQAINPETERFGFQKRRRPLVLLRRAELPLTRRRAAEEISRLVKAERVINDVAFIITHRDCDAIEPEHTTASLDIERELRSLGVENVVAATPAFEMETWWMLFPDEIKSICSCWKQVDYKSSNVGKIVNAKERLIRDLRPSDKKLRSRCMDFVESDGVKVARKIRETGAALRPSRAHSSSFEEFKEKILAIKIV